MQRSYALDPESTLKPFGYRTGRRSAPRLRLSIPARIVTLTDSRRCVLIDLSRTGARIGLAVPLEVDAGVVLQVGTVDQFGIVTRKKVGFQGGSNGIEFEDELNDNAILEMRRYSENLEEEERRAIRREARKWVSGDS